MLDQNNAIFVFSPVRIVNCAFGLFSFCIDAGQRWSSIEAFAGHPEIISA
jgi:hypothetical protein